MAARHAVDGLLTIFLGRSEENEQVAAGSSERGRNSEAELLGSLHVDAELHFCDQLHRQISWFFAIVNAAGIDPDLAERLRKSRPIAHKATRRRVCAAWVHRGHRIAGCQCDKLIMLRATEEHRFAANQERGEGQAEHDQAPAESQAGA